MKLTYLFPTNYKHGNPNSIYYKEEIEFVRFSENYIDFHFRKTNLYNKFKGMSFKYYFKWDSLGNDIYIASPMIFVYYNGKLLKYFHNPKMSEIMFDYYINYGLDIIFKDNSGYLIKDNVLEGSYCIDLTNIW